MASHGTITGSGESENEAPASCLENVGYSMIYRISLWTSTVFHACRSSTHVVIVMLLWLLLQSVYQVFEISFFQCCLHTMHMHTECVYLYDKHVCYGMLCMYLENLFVYYFVLVSPKRQGPFFKNTPAKTGTELRPWFWMRSSDGEKP